MRRINFSLLKRTSCGWTAAVLLLEGFLTEPMKLPDLEALLPDRFEPGGRAACHRHLMAGLRFGGAVERGLERFLKKAPSGRLRAALLVAGGEWSESVLAGKSPAPVVDYAVGRARGILSKPESGFLNALLRRLPEVFPVHSPEAFREALAERRFPDWLRERWADAWGAEGAAQYAEWLHQRSENYLYCPGDVEKEAAGLVATPWGAAWWCLPGGPISREVMVHMANGLAYIKDPSTRLAPDLLRVRPGEKVLDLCAAPGGKSFHLAHGLGVAGTLVAVDLPGERMGRLRENLARLPPGCVQPNVVAADILEELPVALAAAQMPAEYDAVLLDVPCSNTGVLRRRPDVLWHLTESGMTAHPPLQRSLLEAAAACVAPGGRLVYSTCSVEEDENEGVVRTFLESPPGRDFRWIEGGVAFPPLSGHDGAGAFLLQRLVSNGEGAR